MFTFSNLGELKGLSRTPFIIFFTTRLAVAKFLKLEESRENAIEVIPCR